MKTQLVTVRPAGSSISDAIPLSPALQHQIKLLRRPFASYVEDLSPILETRAALAPRFMAAFHQWQQETQGTFVAFVRVLVPDLPLEREAYRKRSEFQAADYLRRLMSLADQQQETVNHGPSPVTPLEGLARLLAAILPLTGDTPSLWASLASALRWSESQVERLQTLAEASEPLLTPHVPAHQRAPLLTFQEAA